jgi:hypothetical protein
MSTTRRLVATFVVPLSAVVFLLLETAPPIRRN